MSRVRRICSPWGNATTSNGRQLARTIPSARGYTVTVGRFDGSFLLHVVQVHRIKGFHKVAIQGFRKAAIAMSN